MIFSRGSSEEAFSGAMYSIFDLLNFYSLLAFAVVLLWYYNRSTYSFWRKLKVKYIEPTPFLGNTAKTVFGLRPLHEEYERLYKALYNEPFGGIYIFRQPSLLVKDPELVTSILIKDFKYFPNHGFKQLIKKNKKVDPLTAHLLFTEDDRWRVLRQKMSPVFSSGKLKYMHEQILDCVHAMTKNVDEQMGENGSIDLGMKKLFEGLTIDVIGSCAFGLDCRSNEKFGKMCREVSKPRLLFILRMLIDSISKRLGDLLNVTVHSKEVNEFFMNMALNTVEYRRINGVVRNDLLQLLMELQNSHVNPKFAVGDSNSKMLLPNEEFDEIDIVANSFFFFVAAFETTASTLSYCFYELALNQNIQDKLRSEVKRAKDKDSKLTYDMLAEMTYLEATISETLRKYPPVQILGRESVQDYTIPGTNIHIPAGTNVIVPVWSIQHDWRNYPNPEVFDPERFLGDNKHSRPSGTLMAFGDGPRSCLGKRFAEMEIKVTIAEMILKYDVKPCAKTEIPLKFQKGAGMLQSTCGTWVSLVKRK